MEEGVRDEENAEEEEGEAGGMEEEGFCDRLDQKSEQFRSSLSLIAIH
jgi:hypothetical protein